MKKFIFGLIMAIVCLAGMSSLTSCDKLSSATHNAIDDSTYVTKIVADFNNPSFIIPSDFANFCSDEVAYNEFVTTAAKLHHTTIVAIATEVVKKSGSVNYISFMAEYKSDKEKYDTFNMAIIADSPEAIPSPTSGCTINDSTIIKQ